MLDATEVQTQRAGPFARFPALVREMGVDPRALAADMPIDVDRIDADTMIRFEDAVVLLERAAAATGCAHFGLVLGSRGDHRDLGIVGALAAHAPTLREALTDFVTWQHRNSRSAVVYLHRLGEDFALGYGIHGPSMPAATHVYDLSLAVAVNAVRRLTGNKGAPVEVHIGHRAPADRRPFPELLRAPVRFDQYQSCVVLPAAIMDLPVVGADPAERARLLGILRAKAAEAMPDVTRRLRHALRPRIATGDVGMTRIAQVMGLTPRTLRRHLAQDGQTFEDVRDSLRYSAAREMLQVTDLPVGDIAAALSFATHSAFVHAFRRWSGTTPTAFRAAARGDASTGRRPFADAM